MSRKVAPIEQDLISRLYPPQANAAVLRATGKVFNTTHVTSFQPSPRRYTLPLPPVVSGRPTSPESKSNNGGDATVIKSLDEMRPSVLPSLSGKQLDTVENNPHALSRKLNSRDGDIDIEQLKKFSTLDLLTHFEQGKDNSFVYLRLADSSNGSLHNAYKVEICLYENLDANDFFILSCGGVTRIQNGLPTLHSIPRWRREYLNFSMLLKMRTFYQFRMWKAFAVWRKNVIKLHAGERLRSISKKLFTLDTSLRPAYLLIRSLCLDAINMRFCIIDHTKPYSLENFITAQDAQLQSVCTFLLELRTKVSDILFNSCNTIFSSFNGTVGSGTFLGFEVLVL